MLFGPAWAGHEGICEARPRPSLPVLRSLQQVSGPGRRTGTYSIVYIPAEAGIALSSSSSILYPHSFLFDPPIPPVNMHFICIVTIQVIFTPTLLVNSFVTMTVN
jgi:hypothetical protein